MRTESYDKLPEGTVIAGCTIEHLAGNGSAAAVYRARDRQSGMVVAVKILNPLLAGDEIIRERLIRELQVGRTIRNKHLAASYSLTKDRSMICLIMEWIDGVTLESVLRKKKSIPLKIAAAILLQSIDGLASLHANGILHRDIKPSNIMILPGNIVKLIDFGIARVVNAATLTRTGTRLGSIEYLAPEYLLGQGYDARCDFYSLGVTFYKILTGHCPHDRNGSPAFGLHRTTDLPAPPSSYRSEIPKSWDRLLLWLLDPNPDMRLSSAELIRHIVTGNMDTPGSHSVETDNNCRTCGRHLSPLLPFCAYCGSSTIASATSGNCAVYINDCTKKHRGQLRRLLKKRFRHQLHPWFHFLTAVHSQMLLVKNVSRPAAENIVNDFVYLPFSCAIHSSTLPMTRFMPYQVATILIIGILSMIATVRLDSVLRVMIGYMAGFFIPVSVYLFIQRAPLIKINAASIPPASCLDEQTLNTMKNAATKFRCESAKGLFAGMLTQCTLLSDRLQDPSSHNLNLLVSQQDAVKKILLAIMKVTGQFDALQSSLSQISQNALNRKRLRLEAEIGRQRDRQRLEKLMQQHALVVQDAKIYRSNSIAAERIRGTLVNTAGTLILLNSMLQQSPEERIRRLHHALSVLQQQAVPQDRATS